MHERADMPADDKFAYLLMYAKGKAARAIARFYPIAENYEEAIRILEKRFGESNPIVNTLTKQLQNLPESGGSVTELRKFIEEVQAIAGQLDRLGHNINQTSSQLEVKRKLPEWILGKVLKAEKAAGAAWDFNALLDKIDDIISVRESVKEIKDDKGKNDVSFQRTDNFSQRTDKFKNRKPHSNAMNLAARNQKKENTIKCVLCDKIGHFPSECDEYKTFTERSDRVLIKGLCFKCLRNGHQSDECRTKLTCAKCKKPNNHPVFCQKNFPNESFAKNEKPKDKNLSNTKTRKDGNRQQSQVDPFRRMVSGNLAVPESSGVFQISNREKPKSDQVRDEVLLTFAKVNVCGPQTHKSVVAFFDSGSSFSFINNSLAIQLKLHLIHRNKVAICTFGQKSPPSAKEYNVYQLNLVEQNSIRLIFVYGCDRLTLETFAITNINKMILSNAALKITNDDIKNPELIIGADYYWDIINGSKHKLPSGFWMLESSVGPLLSGKGLRSYSSQSKSDDAEFSYSIGETHTNESAEGAIKQLWELETLGIKDDPSVNEDDIALQMFLSSIRWDDREKRYFVCWPWRAKSHANTQLGSNYGLALGRLTTTLKKLSSEDKLAYKKILDEQFASQIIEDAPINSDSNLIYYMPHHCVININKLIRKLRMVFDGSSKSSKSVKSLNELLLAGPVLLPEIIGVLLRWRCHKIVVISDVEKAFHQIALER